jgi:hypothetical protein
MQNKSSSNCRQSGKRRAGLNAFALAAAVIFLLLSCSLSLQRIDFLSQATSQGSFLKAAADIKKNETLYGSNDRLLYFMDQGLLLHYAGAYQSSLKNLEKAEEMVSELYARSVTNEAASLLINDLVRPYRGRRHERVLLHQFIAFNYLANNQYDEALVETRKVQLVFDAFSSDSELAHQYQDDGMSHYVSSIVYEAQQETDNALISIFKSVYAYQKSPLKLPDAVNDLAYYRFKRNGQEKDIRLLNLAPTVSKDELKGLNSQNGEIIFIGYAGKSPVIKETIFSGTYVVGGFISGTYRKAGGEPVRIILPAPPLPASELEKIENKEKTKAGTTFHLKLALPEAVGRPSETKSFKILLDYGQQSHNSVVLTDTDVLIEQDIDSNRTLDLTRAAIRVVLRMMTTQYAKDQLKKETPLENILISTGIDLLTDQLEKADTRLCFILPKTIQIARIPVKPAKHRIEVFALNSSGNAIGKKVWGNVIVRQGEKKFLFYPSLM